jgi:hypothetical protein
MHHSKSLCNQLSLSSIWRCDLETARKAYNYLKSVESSVMYVGIWLVPIFWREKKKETPNERIWKKLKEP